jgi:hypothetical protein
MVKVKELLTESGQHGIMAIGAVVVLGFPDEGDGGELTPVVPPSDVPKLSFGVS